MGTPLQEEFLLEVHLKSETIIGFTCGGFIHQTAKGINYYPKWINKFNLRWLFRIFDEPKLFERYFVKYPKSLILLFYDIAKKNSKNESKRKS
jgi:N-acetylglucosaminyldiphosphoundecaprenol N-acetyl-beta-D-mannosaminyltransferase